MHVERPFLAQRLTNPVKWGGVHVLQERMVSASLRRVVEAQRVAADAGALARDSHMEVVQQLQSAQAEVAQRRQEVCVCMGCSSCSCAAMQHAQEVRGM
jgi:hypothetical protein